MTGCAVFSRGCTDVSATVFLSSIALCQASRLDCPDRGLSLLVLYVRQSAPEIRGCEFSKGVLKGGNSALEIASRDVGMVFRA